MATTTKVTLADHLDLANLPLATTPGGRNFALKALHPAESTIKSSRAPGAIVPTVAIACDMVDTIPFPPGAVGAVIQQWPHLTHPMSVTFIDATQTQIGYYVWQNAAIGGGAHPAVNPANWAAIADWSREVDQTIQGYRITSQSITTDVIAPSVANQGTIVSAQFEMRPATRQLSFWDADNGNINYKNVVDLWCYNKPPESSQLLMGTSAYTSQATSGFYQPLKLSRFKFVNMNDTMLAVSDAVNDRLSQILSVKSPTFPVNLGGFSMAAADAPLVKPSSYGVGMTYIEGTAGNPQVSLRIRFRQVAEIIPMLGGVYAPLAEAPLPPDELAFKMVAEIGARMKDAYPASYNDMGTLINAIKKIGKSVLKYADPVLDMVSLVPGAGTIAGGAKMALNLGKGIATLASAKSSKTERAKAEEMIGANASQILGAVKDAAKKRRKARKAKGQKPPPTPPRATA